MMAAIYPRRLLLFLSLSVGDLALTWLLIGRGQGRVSEGNPVAAWYLTRYGWGGLAAFKLLTVLAVVGLTAAVSRVRPRSGGLILSVACAALALVVGYSCYLEAAGVDGGGQPEAAELARLGAEEADMDVELQREAEYRRALDQLSADLAAGRRSLIEATARLNDTLRARDPAWLGLLHADFPERSDQECLAANLALNTIVSVRDDPAEAKRLARRLARDLTASFGPSRHWRSWHLLRQAGLRSRRPHHASGGRLG